MQKRYWNMLFDFKVAEYYFQLYVGRAARISVVLSALIGLGGAGCVLAWCTTGRVEPLGGTLIVCAQMFTILQPFLPYAKRGIAGTYTYREMARLARAVEEEWESFSDETPPEEVARWLADRKTEFLQIENRYTSTDLFPWSPKLHKKAQDSALAHFKRCEEGPFSPVPPPKRKNHQSFGVGNFCPPTTVKRPPPPKPKGK